MSGSFTGVRPSAFEFLQALSADNTKAFFDRERDTYQGEIAEPAKLLVDALAVELPDRVHPRLRGEARVGRSLTEIHLSHTGLPADAADHIADGWQKMYWTPLTEYLTS